MYISHTKRILYIESINYCSNNSRWQSTCNFIIQPGSILTLRSYWKNFSYFRTCHLLLIVHLKPNITNVYLAQEEGREQVSVVVAVVIIIADRPHVVRISISWNSCQTGIVKLRWIMVPPNKVAISDALDPHLNFAKRTFFLW